MSWDSSTEKMHYYYELLQGGGGDVASEGGMENIVVDLM